MKISARNAFAGTVDAIKSGAINAEIDIALPGGLHIVATVTNDAVSELGLTPGKPVTALIKASSVLVLTDGNGVKLSARNCLPGTITALVDGPVSSEVAIGLANGSTVFATITHEGSVALGLQIGISASAVFKAPSVLLAVSA
jgi:molybdate transport system regulatory protein